MERTLHCGLHAHALFNSDARMLRTRYATISATHAGKQLIISVRTEAR